MKKLLSKSNILTIIILLLALFLRSYHLYNRSNFNADQEWLATRASDVIKGDIALLGPITSVGGFSIGPYFIYLWAFISIFLGGHPIAGAILSVFLGVISLLMIYLFIKEFVDEKSALITIFLCAISVTQIAWDQTPWAPSLFFISQVILLYGAYISNKKLIGYLYIAAGFVLGFSSHFGIVLSLISVLIYFLFVKPVKINYKYFIATLAILLLGLLPNILFDITHNFINLKRMITIFNGDGLDYFVSFNKVIMVLIQNSIGLIYPRNLSIIDSIIRKVLFALLVANGARNIRDRKYRKISILAIVTTIFPAAFFYLQQGKFSEYYLLMTLPSSLILLALLIKDLLKKFKYLVVLAVLFATFINYDQFNKMHILWNLAAKERVVKEIVARGGHDNYGISLTTRFGEQFGFRYLLDNNKVKASMPPKKGETKIFSIIIPEGHDGMYGMEDIDGIGLRWSGI